MPLVLIMKDKVEELSNIGIKTFAIGTGDKEAIDEGATTGSNRTVGESFGFCCPGGVSSFTWEHQHWIHSNIYSQNVIACEQAPKWGIGRRQKSSSERG